MKGFHVLIYNFKCTLKCERRIRLALLSMYAYVLYIIICQLSNNCG